MGRTTLRIACSLLVIGVSPTAWGKPHATVEINQGDQATADFKFKSIPAPSQTDAANSAKVRIVSGRRDGNGGQPGALIDGKTPTGADEPGANFFFAAGTDGGRVLFDLGRDVAVKQINSYSWHPDSRAPQVYRVYGKSAGGAGDEFDPQTAAAEKLTDAGWELVASVDSRPEEGSLGGQVGVMIADDEKKGLGDYRYLLFEIERTENDTPFGQTFFSEIDVDDGEKHAAPERPAPDVVRIADKYEITFDASDAPDLKPWIDETLKPICIEWYPKIVEMLPSEGYSAPERFTIYFHSGMNGVAHAMGTEIHCAEPWFSQNLDGEAPGAVVHEMVHIVQQYGRTRGARRNPGWMVEGLADYIRWFLYEPVENRRQPNPDRAKYTDSYRTTAAFLDYLVGTHDPKIIEKFNAAMRNGEYEDGLWEKWTGKSVDELWAEYVRELKK